MTFDLTDPGKDTQGDAAEEAAWAAVDLPGTAYIVLYTDFETPGASTPVGVLISQVAAEEHVARCYVEQAAAWLHDEEEDLKAAEEDGDEVDAPLDFYVHLAESVKDDIGGYSIDTAPLHAGSASKGSTPI